MTNSELIDALSSIIERHPHMREDDYAVISIIVGILAEKEEN